MKSEKQNEVRELARSVAITGQRVGEIGRQITALRGELVQANEQRAAARASEPTRWASIKTRLKFDSNTAKLDRRIKDLNSRVADLVGEYETLGAELAKSEQRLAEARQKSRHDRRSRCAAAADEAAQAAPSRKRFLDARNKLNDVKDRLRAGEAEIHKILTTPLKEQTDAIEVKAQEFLNGGELGDIPTVERNNPRLIELMRQSKTLTAAIRLQERELNAAQQEYSRDIAAKLLPKFADLAQRLAASVRETLDATVEDLSLRTAASVESGGMEVTIPALRFHGVQPDFADQVLDGYLNRLRRGGFEV